MAHSYTPGLKVLHSSIVEKVRRLPIKGKVIKSIGDKLLPDEVVATTDLPGNVRIIKVANILSIGPSDIFDSLKVKIGEKVKKGDLIAQTEGIFGFFKSEVFSPIDGSIESISDVTGDGVEACKDVPEGTVVTASDLLRYDVATLMPGAINTFALIISSYTIVLALKTAKNANWKPSDGFMGKLMPTRQAAVRNYLIATLALGSLFIVLKLVEWSHLVAEGFDIGTVQGSIFYIATGAHGLHVFIGLLVMLYLVFKADTVGFDEDNAQGIEYFGLYWHFVDLAWVVIFPAFYLY